MLTASEAILAVSDVRQTVRFYRDVLGFESEWLWQDPPTFGGVRWGKVHIMFCVQPDLAGKVEGHQHWLKTDDVQGMYERHKSTGVAIVSEIENKPWGFREYTVRDINGYHLRFCGSPTYERLPGASEVIPAHIRIEKRTPAIEDFIRINRLVGWTGEREILAESISRSLFCICATDTRHGQMVGAVRVCGDGHFYTIWDVMVQPEYQGEKIGSAMMEMALAELRKIGPKGAFVGLFTGKSEFYERLGFVKDGGMHVSL